MRPVGGGWASQSGFTPAANGAGIAGASALLRKGTERVTPRKPFEILEGRDLSGTHGHDDGEHLVIIGWHELRGVKLILETQPDFL